VLVVRGPREMSMVKRRCPMCGQWYSTQAGWDLHLKAKIREATERLEQMEIPG